MKKNKILDFIITILFLISIASFALYLRNYLIINSSSVSEVNSIMTVYLARYRNVALFTLIIGFILMIFKSLLQNNNKVYIEDKTLDDLTKNRVFNFEFINSNIGNRKIKVLDYNDKTNTFRVMNEIGEEKNDTKYINKCDECYRAICKDANTCANYSKKKKLVNGFNPVTFAVNMIIVLLCIIVMILLINKIKVQRDINNAHINFNTIIKTVETK